MAEIYKLAEADLQQAWQVFRDFDDKKWSLTDCASKVTVDNFGISKAVALETIFGSLEL